MPSISQIGDMKGEQQYLDDIRSQMIQLSDPAYAKFQSALLRKPDEETLTGSAAHFLGVRLPQLRKLAGQLTKENWEANLNAVKAANRKGEISDSRYEELMLEGMLIGLADKQKISHQKQFLLIAEFVPLIDNWGLCDSFCAGLKFVEECPDACWDFLQFYLQSEKEYEIRFGVVMLLVYFIRETYIDRLFPVFDRIRHDGYYVKMAVAWAISICYVKFPDRTLTYLKNNALDDFTYRKALQKITESRCVSAKEKAVIRSMRVRTT